jgi:hypothetical protein
MSFVKRWARLKEQATIAQPITQRQPAKAEAKKAVELPALDSLTFDSDFAAFLRADIEESVKRAALKKLLHDPRFNVMDGLDTYIDDYSKNDPIPEEMLKTLDHARSTLFGPRQESSEPPVQETVQASEEKGKPEQQSDGDTRQDT